MKKQGVIIIYCNSCMTQINKDDGDFCTQCNVPLHKSCSNHCLACGKALCDTCYMENNYHCESCKPPVESFKVIRRSHIELFNTCPYALYLILTKGIEPPANDYAKLGTALHQIIDEFSSDMITFEEALKRAAESVEELDPANQETFLQTALKSIHEFNDLRVIHDTFGKNFETEINITYELEPDLPKISCTLDRVDHGADGEIHISDWKTGKPMSGQKLITDLQPPLYIEAVNNMYGKYPKTFTFYYLAHSKIKRYELQDTESPTYVVSSGRNHYTLVIEEALGRTKDILTKINNHQFSMPKDVHQYYCQNMCWFYKSGICASASKEQWKVLNDKYSL